MSTAWDHPVVTSEEWLRARRALLVKEKELTRARDELAATRQALPWERVAKAYVFETEMGQRTLRELFDGCGQLIVYHFMYGPDWMEGCPSCSFWTDSWDGTQIHLAHRDTSFVMASRAPLGSLLAYQKRMGWSVPWVSSLDTDFNMDFGVSFTEDQQRDGGLYNYAPAEHPMEEAPGLSVFVADGEEVFHTYSCYARGLDPLNTAYQLLDLTPKGRDEAALPWTMAWLRRHDAYGDE